MAAHSKVHRLHGTFHRYEYGQREQLKVEEDGMLAVVSGLVRLEFFGESPQERIMLRPSDAVAIPAHTQYVLEALEDSVLYAYAERGQEPTPWGV
jgi:hypothetical protein